MGLTETASRISKQPNFKGGAVRIKRAEGVVIHEKHSDAIKRAEARGDADRDRSVEGRKAHLGGFLALIEATCSRLTLMYDELSEAHKAEGELLGGFGVMRMLAKEVEQALKPFLDKHAGADKDDDDVKAAEDHVDNVKASLYAERRPRDMLGDFARLMDLHSVRVVLGAMQAQLVCLQPTAMALRDEEGFPEAVALAQRQTKRQVDWVEAQLQVRAPQTLIVPAKGSSGRNVA